jgi:hypothetical protein
MINRELRQALLDKLNISPSALSQRIKRLKKQIPMTTDQGAYLIAHQEGIPIDKYLSPEMLARVRELVQQVHGISNTTVEISPKKCRKSVSQRQIVIAKEFKVTDPILPDSKLNEAKEMAALYPLLYVLENSIREFIDRIMTSNYGVDWWENVSAKLKRDVQNRMTDEKKHSWHQRRASSDN